MLKHKNIESYLPVFNGFYGTFFEPDEDSSIEENYTYDDYNFDYDDYKLRVSKACVDKLESKLIEIVRNKGIKITYQGLYSPKYYNFSNDVINVKYKLTSDAIKCINDYLLTNFEAFKEHINEKYTSYSGFSSFWSNDASIWITKHINNKKDLTHTFGEILDFILKNEDYTTENLASDISHEMYVGGTLKEKVK